MEIVPVTNERREVIAPDLLAAAEPIFRQLRVTLPDEYRTAMARAFADGAEMIVALDEGNVVAVALFRTYYSTVHGNLCYVDELVTDATLRSRGIGRAMLGYIETEARRRGCNVLKLASGVDRTDAHRFYFREGLVINSFNFRKRLGKPSP